MRTNSECNSSCNQIGYEIDVQTKKHTSISISLTASNRRHVDATSPASISSLMAGYVEGNKLWSISNRINQPWSTGSSLP